MIAILFLFFFRHRVQARSLGFLFSHFTAHSEIFFTWLGFGFTLFWHRGKIKLWGAPKRRVHFNDVWPFICPLCAGYTGNFQWCCWGGHNGPTRILGENKHVNGPLLSITPPLLLTLPMALPLLPTLLMPQPLPLATSLPLILPMPNPYFCPCPSPYLCSCPSSYLCLFPSP